MPQKKKNKKVQSYLLIGFLFALLFGFIVLVLFPQMLKRPDGSLSPLSSLFQKQPSPTPDPKKIIGQTTKTVLPEKYNLKVSFGSSVKKLVEAGAIDKQKFLALYKSRNGIPDEYKNLLDQESDRKIIVTKENADIILNLLWPLGIANKSQTLSKGPMGTISRQEAGSFASTGGWTLGKEEGGKLFNRFSILPLTDDQETMVTEIAQNIYRPCCDNSTYFPDCNHGAAILGYIQLAVTQGLSKEEIYKEALVLNSYWFPQTYVELALYFKTARNIDWDKIDPKTILAAEYSSGTNYSKINKSLQSAGLIPKVEDGGSCGV